MAREHIFYPRWDKKMLAGALFFGLLGGANLVKLVMTGGDGKAALVIIGSLTFALAGLWLARGMSWPWSGPALRLNDAGITIWPKRWRPYFMPWNDIEFMASEGANNRTLFIPKDAGKHIMRLGPFKSPPHCPDDLWNEAGEDLGVVVVDFRPDWDA